MVLTKQITFQVAYKTQRNRVNRLIKTSKREFCLQSIDSNKHNPKEMWKNINLIIGRIMGRCSKTTVIPSIKVTNNILTKEEDIAKPFNTYFTEVGENLAINLEESNKHFSEYITPVTSKYEFSTVTNDLISHAISDMKSSKAAGLDEISTPLQKFHMNMFQNHMLSHGNHM